MSKPTIQSNTIVSSERLACLDAYRGFVILVMIWVNFIWKMPEIPAWLKHAGAGEDTFTFPDLVFPGFLFMLGISIALALGRVQESTASTAPALRKIFWRALSLIVAGVMMVNADRYDANAALLPRALYYLLFYVSMILLWRQSERRDARFWFGAALMAFLMLSFRGATDAEFNAVWLQHAWWGILGMIGWTYACCSLAYLATRGNSTALMGVFAFMIALYMGGEAGTLDFLPKWMHDLFHVGELFGSTAANVLAGTLVGNLFLQTRIKAADVPDTRGLIHRHRIKFMLFFSLGLIIAGLLLRPYHHINKIHATESFTLVCAGINLLAFMLFYLLMDVLQWRGWAAFLIPAGANALFAYIIPDLWNQLVSVLGLKDIWSSIAWPYLEQGGMAGLVNAAMVTLFMFGITAWANRAGLRLKF